MNELRKYNSEYHTATVLKCHRCKCNILVLCLFVCLLTYLILAQFLTCYSLERCVFRWQPSTPIFALSLLIQWQVQPWHARKYQENCYQLQKVCM